jgi:hypothetical protein
MRFDLRVSFSTIRSYDIGFLGHNSSKQWFLSLNRTCRALIGDKIDKMLQLLNPIGRLNSKFEENSTKVTIRLWKCCTLLGGRRNAVKLYVIAP